MMTPISHPGRLLKRELSARGLSANRLALDLGVPSGRVTDILNGRRAISADTAVRLGRYFGNGPQFWARPSGPVRDRRCRAGEGRRNRPQGQTRGRGVMLPPARRDNRRLGRRGAQPGAAAEATGAEATRGRPRPGRRHRRDPGRRRPRGAERRGQPLTLPRRRANRTRCRAGCCERRRKWRRGAGSAPRA
jgi:addiction module HigA family antidote